MTSSRKHLRLLAADIDDIADAIAMEHEYGLCIRTLSETRKLDRQQQEALRTQQLNSIQRALEISYDFANFTADFILPSYMGFLGVRKIGPEDESLSKNGYLQLAVDTAIAIVPGWMRKGKKAVDVFKDLELFVDASTDGGSVLKESFSVS